MSETCDLFAHRVVGGRDTGEISTLHTDLIGLGKIAKKFARWKANRAFYLAQSKEFIEGKSLMRDENGEPTMVSLYEEAKYIFGEDVTIEHVRKHLNDKWGETNLQYRTAFDKMKEFNKKYRGSKTFMATIELQPDDTYALSIVYNTEEEQLKLIDTIANMETVLRIDASLTRNGINISEGPESKYFVIQSFMDGIKGTIALTEGKSFSEQLGELANATGSFLIDAYGTDNNFVKRLLNIVDTNFTLIAEEVLKDTDLGNRGRSARARGDKKEIQKINEEAASKLIGYYLRHYNSIKPTGVIGNIVHILLRFREYVVTHWPIGRKDYYKALYDAKYAAYGLAKLFMGTNFKVYQTNMNRRRKKFLENSNALSSIIDAAQQVSLFIGLVKNLKTKPSEEFSKSFSLFMKRYNTIINDYEEKINAGVTEEFLEQDTTEKAFQSLMDLALLLVNEIATLVPLLATAWSGVDEYGNIVDISLSQHSTVVDYNQKLYDTLINVQESLNNLKLKSLGNDVLAKRMLALSEKIDTVIGRVEYKQTEWVEDDEGGEVKQEVTVNAKYLELILSCRRSLCLKLLNQINGSDYLGIEQYVSVDWLTVHRHLATVLKMENILDKTDMNPPGQWVSRWLDSMADSPDLINKMVYDCIEELKHKANVQTLAVRERLRSLYQLLPEIKYYDADGKLKLIPSAYATELFFERYSYQLDEYGNVRTDDKGNVVLGHDLTGNLLDLDGRNWGEWERAKKADMKAWKEDYWEKSFSYMLIENVNSVGSPVRSRQFKYGDAYSYNGKTYILKEDDKQSRKEYREHFHDFIKANAVVHTRDFNSKRDMYSSETYLIAYGDAMARWHERNSVEIVYKDKEGKPVIDNKGENVTIFAPALKTDGKNNHYDNVQCTILRDTRNQDLINWYKAYLQIKRDLDEMLPNGATHPLGLRAPQFMGTVINRLHNAYEGDNSGRVFGRTIFEHISLGIAAMSPNDWEIGGDHNTYDADEVADDKRSLIFDSALSNALSEDERLPMYGVRKLKKMSLLSTDLMHSTLAYCSMALNYGCLDEVVGAVENLREQLDRRKVKSTIKQNQKKRKQNTPAYYHRLEDYMKFLVYNDYAWSKKYNPLRNILKLVGKAVRLSAFWYLGGNIHSAAVNKITGMTELFKEAWAGSKFNTWTLLKAMAVYRIGAGAAFFLKLSNIFTQKGSTVEDHSKFTLFLRRMNTLNDNETDFTREFMETPGWSITKGFSIADISMLPYTMADKWMMSIAYIASAMTLKVVHKDDIGKPNPRTMSVWDMYTTKELTIDVNGKKIKETVLACKEGEFTDWYIKNDHISRIKELIRNKHKRDLSIPADEQTFLDLDNEYSPWDFKTENRFRLQCRGINNRLHGIYNKGDGSAIAGLIIGPALLSLKKYAIGMFDRRFARATLDYRTGEMRLGSTTTFIDLFIDLVINKNAYSGESANPQSLKYKLDTLPAIRLIFGLANFLFLYLWSVQPGFQGYKWDYLRKRGYSDEQIRNIDRAVADMVAIVLDTTILSICQPPDDDQVNDHMYGISTYLMNLELAILRFLPGRKTIDDATNLTADLFIVKDLAANNEVPFAISGMIYYLAYRALREQYAYNVFFGTKSWKYGVYPELRTLTESMLPVLAGAADLYKVITLLSPVIYSQIAGKPYVTEEDLEKMVEEGDTNAYDKYDTDKVEKPYGAEIYQRGYNLDYYKYSKAIIQHTPFLRSLPVLRNGPYSASSMDWASQSDLTKERYWKKGGIEGIEIMDVQLIELLRWMLPEDYKNNNLLLVTVNK